MSRSSQDARIKISSELDALEVTVFNSRFGVEAHGFGELDAELAPGIYELQLRAGPTVETRLLKLEPGALHEETGISMAVPSPAPIEGTSTSREAHQEAVRAASRMVVDAPSSLVVMLRNVPGDKVPFVADDLGRLTVVGSDLEPLPGQWEVDRAHESAVWAAPVNPGGVALKLVRTDPEGHATFEYRPLTIVDEWQVLVFVPNTRIGPAPQQATIHMAHRYVGWDSDYESARIGVALELALGGLRTGRAVVPRDLRNLLLNTKFRNPMLGVIGAHALLAEARPNFDLLETVLGNLGGLLGEHHPDLVGLRWLREEARSSTRPDVHSVPPLPPVTWPPTVLAAYQALLRLDPIRPGSVAAGSPAERAASRIEASGVWTSWTEPAAGVRGDRAQADPGRERVADYVRGVAALHGITEQEALAKRVNEQQTALSVGLPISLVNRILGELRNP